MRRKSLAPFARNKQDKKRVHSDGRQSVLMDDVMMEYSEEKDSIWLKPEMTPDHEETAECFLLSQMLDKLETMAKVSISSDCSDICTLSLILTVMLFINFVTGDHQTPVRVAGASHCGSSTPFLDLSDNHDSHHQYHLLYQTYV